ncbi:ATP-binding protein [Natrarchaeobius oligotrophus]|uniref:histidine kinase n=1 Tax=Natrarchaeobius chitinivorans TaxID=1679083 RepID=A0A3N6PD72_NATCH|nr:PAS domain-containing sensor histidine kinase [Natrarchaeobius chitinivorans]RQG97589.1 PAS domain-containing sensor histidine kinase [Natrarchaeobius chitinivorans]
MGSSGAIAIAGFDALPAHVAILDRSGTIVHTNRSWEEFGDDQGLAEGAGNVGANYLDVCDGSDGDDAANAASGIRDVAAGDRETYSFEYPCHTPERDRWFSMNATAYDHDRERYVLVMHVDITDRRRLEQRAREQAERMEAFATLLSHDLRNPLSVALAEAQSLERSDLSDAVNDRSESIVSSLQRMETMLEEALVLVGTDDVERTEPVLLADAVDEAWSHVRTESASVSATERVGVRADPSLLSHLFENLFRNSVEHGGSTPSVDVGPLETAGDATAESARDSATAVSEIGFEGEFDGFYVEDDGPGFDAADRDRLFESGYTTESDGSGFGLAIVRRVVDAHDWSIDATTTDDGARFEIRDVDVFAV